MEMQSPFPTITPSNVSHRGAMGQQSSTLLPSPTIHSSTEGQHGSRSVSSQTLPHSFSPPTQGMSQQRPGFVPSAPPSSTQGTGYQGTVPMTPLAISSSSLHGVTGQQSSGFAPHSAMPSAQSGRPQESSTAPTLPSTPIQGMAGGQDGSHNPLSSPSMRVDLSTLQGFYNREQAAVEYSRMHSRYGNHLLSQVNFWKQTFNNLQGAYQQLQADHTALLTRYELAVTHNVDAGPIIMENMLLRRNIYQLQNGGIQPTQVGSFPETNDVTPIDDDSEYSDYSGYE